MESDSIHAAVETAKKRTSVYVPSQRDTIITMARKKKTYTVVPLKYFDFLNLKPLTESILPSSAVDTNGKKVEWMKVRWLQVRKSDPQNIHAKYDFDELQFHTVKTKASRKHICVANPIQRRYNEKLPISSAKKQDLISLCKDGNIPSEFYHYFQSITDSKSLRDCLPDPDILEEDNDSDTNV